MSDYGMRKKSKGARGLWIGLAVFLVIAVVIGYLAIGKLQPQWVAEARAWTVKGPPCPTVSAAAFKSGGAPINETFEYDDVVFARAFGIASCAQIHDHGGVGFGRTSICQFSSPRALSAHAAKSDTFYALEVGQPVTVTIDGGSISCVIGASQFPPPG